MKTKVNYADEAGKLKAPRGNKKTVPKVKKCMYTNCPINASTEVLGQYRCSFHESGHFHGEVTIAILGNINFIKGYNSMVKWDVPDWIGHKKWLQEHKNCPMQEDETPSHYLIRFFAWISEKIKLEASEHIERKLQ